MIKRFIFCFFFFCCFQAFAIPKGKSVVSGDARDSYKVDQNLLKISTSDKAVIHWDSFSIENFEKVVFDMPNQSSAVLNRVVGRVKSSILGALQANGNVFLINPQGILIGKDACIDVNGFLASTFDVLDEKFLNNGDMVFSGNSKEKIINLGTIKAIDGDVILLGRIVENSGVLEAKSGDVCIGVGKEILLKPMDKERIYIKPLLEDEKEDIGIDNSGEILAKNVEMKADGNLYSLAIKNSGKVDAYSLVEKDGRILLEAKDGRVEINGSLVAKKEKGGTIHVLGKEVGLLNEAYLDASSDTGGGEILIGGDYKGENESIYNSRAVVVFPDAVIKANANEDGDGGKVIFWANDYMDFHGSAFTKGGEIKGDGGFIEISSKGYWNYSGNVNASSYNGKNGQILFDPDELKITNTSPSAPLFPINPPPPPYTYKHGTANLFVDDLEDALGFGAVTVEATGNLVFEADLTTPGNLTLKAPNGIIEMRGQYTVNSAPSEINLCQVIGGSFLVVPFGSDAGIAMEENSNLTIDCRNVFINDGFLGKGEISTENGIITIKNCYRLDVISGANKDALISTKTGEININKGESTNKDFFFINSLATSTGLAKIVGYENGKIEINFQGDSSIQPNRIETEGSGQSGIFNVNKEIKLICGDLNITSAQGKAGIFVDDDGGNIDFEVNDLSIESGDADAGIFASSVTSNSNITGKSNSINLVSKNGVAAIAAPKGTIDITNAEGITLTASGSANCYISCLNSLNVDVYNIDMYPTSNNTFITTTGGGAVNINSDYPGGGSINLHQAGNNFASYIATETGGDVRVFFSENSFIKGSLNGAQECGIFSGKTSGSGNIYFLSGDLKIFGGNSGIRSKGGGNINFVVGHLTLKEELGGGDAYIQALNGSIEGALTLSMTLESKDAEAFIKTTGGIDMINVGDITLRASGANDCYISCLGSLTMERVGRISMYPTGSDTYITTTGGGHINITGDGGVNLNTAGSPYSSYIATDIGGNIDVHFSGNSSFRAGNSNSGIFSAINSGSGTVNFSSGNLTIRGASGGVGAKAGIYAALGGAGAGDVIFNVGHLTLIGGAAGVAVIQSEKGDVKDSSASSIGLTSNAAEAAIIAPNGNVKIDRAGAVSLTAAGVDDCFIFGKSSLEMQGVTSITMNSTYANTFIATNGGGPNLTINSLSNPGSGGINLSGTNFASFIETLNGGDIDVHFLGESSFTAGNADCGIFSARNSGSGYVNFSSGDLTITGASSGGGGALSGIYSEIGGVGSGDVTFNVGNLSLIGGCVGEAAIFSTNGDIKGSATSMSLTSNEGAAYIESQSGGIDIDNAGAVSLTAAESSECSISSLSSLNMLGVDRITMFPTGSNTFITTNSNGASLAINSVSSPGSGGINLNPNASNFLSYIATDQGGNVDVHFSEASYFTAGDEISGIFSGFSSGNGYINFSSGDLTVTGGTGSGTSLAGIFSGYESGDFTGSGDIFMDVGDLILQAGSGVGIADRHNAEIRAGSGSGSVFINATGEVNLLGGSGDNCSSYIRATSAAPSLVDIIANKIFLNSHSSSINSEAAIITTSGIVFITTNNDVYVKANAAPAYIERLNTMYCGNDLILESNKNEAYIEAVTGSTPLIDVADDLKLIAIGANAKIDVLSTDVLFNVGEDLVLSAQNSTGVFGASIDGANATFNVGRNVELFGNDNTNAGFAEISFTNNISVNAGRVELQGGNSTVSGAFATIESLGGNLNLTTNFGGVELIGGRSSGSNAYLRALSGTMNLYVQGTLDMQAPQVGKSFIEANSFSGFFVNRTLSMLGSDDNAYIKSLSGALNVTAGENIFLNGNARVENNTGPLSLIAGNNMYIRNLSIIKNTGGEDVTLVVDNDYPVSPARGHGHFIFDGNSLIEDGKVRIFTVERDFDIISGSINGVPYVPGVEFRDSNQERWEVYYPNAFFGGPGFTIFYKNTEDSHHKRGLEYVAFASAELFYRLNNMKVDFDILDLYDRCIKRSKKYLVDYLYDNRKNEKNKLSKLELK